MLLPNSIFIWQFIYVTFRRDLVLHFGSLLLLSTVITFEASMLGPKCNNGFITFRTNGLLHLRPNFVTFRTFITFKTSLVLHLAPLLHLGPYPYYI